jgi:hypothetical protein
MAPVAYQSRIRQLEATSWLEGGANKSVSSRNLVIERQDEGVAMMFDLARQRKGNEQSQAAADNQASSRV